MRHVSALLLATGLLLPTVAAASPGSAAPPVVDAGKLPAGAVVRPAGVGDDRHPVEARLLVEPAVAVPGGTVSIGVHFVQDAGWHTYWRMPGSTGLPPNLVVEGLPGATARPRAWPVPERFQLGEEVSYGYDDQVLHELVLDLPADLPVGEHPITVRADWLVCKTSCIQGAATLHGKVVVGAAERPGPHAEVFAWWRDRWPVPVENVEGVTVEVLTCREPVVSTAPVRTVVAVTPQDGHAIAPAGEGAWPTFTPIVGDAQAWDLGAPAVRVHDGAVLGSFLGTPWGGDPLPTADPLGGLVQVEVDGRRVAFEALTTRAWAPEGTAQRDVDDPRCALFDAPAIAATPPAPPAPDPSELPEAPKPATNDVGPAAWSASLLLTNLLLAFVGGLILNVMPCVLPVLTIKLYGLVKQGDIGPADRRRAGLAYTAGIVASFVALAAAVWALRTVYGESVGWGFQMQHPAYVAAVTTVVFLFGLSFFGVFEIPAFGTERAHDLSSREGPAGYFFTGVFATLVATPCSAPFLGTATAFAFQAPTWLLFVIFTLIGLGLAAPFLLVAFVPQAYALLPKPGAWMETFKQVLGFTLMATTVWLVGVFFGLTGEERGLSFLAFLVTAALAAWVFGHFGGVVASGRQQLQALAGAAAILAFGAWSFVDTSLAAAEECAPTTPVATDGLDFGERIPWQAFSAERLEALRGRVVFVDFTADWCVSCKFNEKTVLETRTVREAMAQYGVVPLVADLTRRNPELQSWLDRHGRAGVPMYLVVPPSGPEQAVVLPEVITTTMVVEALASAAGQPVGRR